MVEGMRGGTRPKITLWRVGRRGEGEKDAGSDQARLRVGLQTHTHEEAIAAVHCNVQE